MKPSCRGGPWRRRWGNPSCSSPPTDLTIKLCDCHFVTFWLKWQSCHGHGDDDFDESHDDNQVDQNIDIQNMFLLTTFILIGHKADHCLPLSLTDSLINSRNVVETWMLWLWLVKMPTQNLLMLKMRRCWRWLGRDLEVEVWSRYRGWSLVMFWKSNFCSEHKVWSWSWNWSSG